MSVRVSKYPVTSEGPIATRCFFDCEAVRVFAAGGYTYEEPKSHAGVGSHATQNQDHLTVEMTNIVSEVRHNSTLLC